MRLWEVKDTVDQAVERFCVGDDFLVDQALVPYDIEASIAHARGLAKIGLLTPAELQKLVDTFAELKALDAEGKFRIRPEDEDCHTAIELFLTQRLGDLGKKIHTGRSRNDQVAAALRLYQKDRLRAIAEASAALAEALLNFAETHKAIALPGYTHTRKAMPSSLGLWGGAFAESLLDDLLLLESGFRLIDQSPLGSAAGYGVPLPLDREGVARTLGFARVQNNVLYVQNSRGKFEAFLVSVLSQIMMDLNRMATDLIFYSLDELQFITLPERFCTGSSIMPQKRNPDVLELVRGHYAAVAANGVAIQGMLGNLISGYHRDLQHTKESFIRASERTVASVSIMARIVPELEVHKSFCAAGCTPEIFAAAEALEMARQGIPFRDAYRKVKERVTALGPQDAVTYLQEVRHSGGPGKLGLDKARKALERLRAKSPLFKEPAKK
jgi:argininosuccinate lyase